MVNVMLFLCNIYCMYFASIFFFFFGVIFAFEDPPMEMAHKKCKKLLNYYYLLSRTIISTTWCDPTYNDKTVKVSLSYDWEQTSKCPLFSDITFWTCEIKTNWFPHFIKTNCISRKKKNSKGNSHRDQFYTMSVKYDSENIDIFTEHTVLSTHRCKALKIYTFLLLPMLCTSCTEYLANENQ